MKNENLCSIKSKRYPRYYSPLLLLWASRLAIGCRPDFSAPTVDNVQLPSDHIAGDLERDHFTLSLGVRPGLCIVTEIFTALHFMIWHPVTMTTTLEPLRTKNPKKPPSWELVFKPEKKVVDQIISCFSLFRPEAELGQTNEAKVDMWQKVVEMTKFPHVISENCLFSGRSCQSWGNIFWRSARNKQIPHTNPLMTVHCAKWTSRFYFCAKNLEKIKQNYCPSTFCNMNYL